VDERRIGLIPIAAPPIAAPVSMAHSILEYQGTPLLLNDIVLIGGVRFLMDVRRLSSFIRQQTKRLDGMLEEWDGTLETYIPGCIELNLEIWMTEDEVRREFNVLLSYGIAELVKLDGIIAGEYLNAIVDDKLLPFSDQPTFPFIDCLRRISNLIEQNTNHLSEGGGAERKDI
jgi:hypothetical protein